MKNKSKKNDVIDTPREVVDRNGFPIDSIQRDKLKVAQPHFSNTVEEMMQKFAHDRVEQERLNAARMHKPEPKQKPERDF